MGDARKRAEKALARLDRWDAKHRPRTVEIDADDLRVLLAEEDATAPSESDADREVRDLRERIYRLRLTLPDYLPDSASEAAAVIRECADDVAVRLVRIKRMLDIV